MRRCWRRLWRGIGVRCGFYPKAILKRRGNWQVLRLERACRRIREWMPKAIIEQERTQKSLYQMLKERDDNNS